MERGSLQQALATRERLYDVVVEAIARYQAARNPGDRSAARRRLGEALAAQCCHDIWMSAHWPDA